MRRFRGVVFVVACAGCGGNVEVRTSGGGAAGSAGLGGNGGSGGVTMLDRSDGAATAGTGGSSRAGVDAATLAARVRACDHWYTVQSACTLPALPSEETPRLMMRFRASCTAAFDQNGATETAADVEACAAALENWPCGSPDGPPLECDLRGSLPGAAPCIADTQCASGRCEGTSPSPTPGGIIPSAVTCGACVATVGVGQSCNEAACAKGSVCITNDTSSSVAGYNCVAVVEVGRGEQCDGLRAFCKPSLYCSASSKTCEPLGKLGEACSAEGPAGCVTPLVCKGNPGTCRAPGPAGTFCGNIVSGNSTSAGLGNWTCMSGLACSAAGECEPVTWADPGEACDGMLTYCRQGSCPTDPITGWPMPGTCPNIIADGMPCNDTDSCDANAECVNAKAKVGATTGVCTPRTAVDCR